MTTPQEKLAAARAELARLEREVAQMSCRERGAHRWKHEGGRNVGCDDSCNCSCPVYVCEDCGDSNYGDNAERDRTLQECLENRGADFGRADV